MIVYFLAHLYIRLIFLPNPFGMLYFIYGSIKEKLLKFHENQRETYNQCQEDIMICQVQLRKLIPTGLLLIVLLSSLCQIAFASAEYRLSKGQTLYVPVYSNIFSAPKKIPFNLATILSIRNTDMSNSIKILAADYYDTRGKLVRKYYRQPITLAPLESTDIFIPEDDTAGGTGANFIVRWNSQKEVNVPIIECVMIGMKSGQGISFVSPGQEIKETDH